MIYNGRAAEGMRGARDFGWERIFAHHGRDVRSGGFAIEAFRGSALASHAGVVALARAFWELPEKTGE
jgi:hypothetical protein